jgi:hypothetical protein
MTVENELTYSDRRLELVKIEKVQGGALTWDNGFSLGIHAFPEEFRELVQVGTSFVMETIGFARVTGMALVLDRDRHEPTPNPGHWLWRLSDQDLEDQSRQRREEHLRTCQQQWEENHDDWAAREARLPDPLRRRLGRFRINGGHAFEIEGWGYELIVSELAVLYATSNLEDSEEISAYAAAEGTSGNQHDFAKALAQGLIESNVFPEVADAIANARSALAPLTGDNDYSKAGQT